MEFDVATAALLAVAGLLLLGLLMQLIGHHGDRASRLAFQLWNLALVLQGLGLGVLALRDRLPETLAVILGNGVLAAGLTVLVAAVLVIGELRFWRWLVLIPLVHTAILAWYVVAENSLHMRIIVGSLGMALLLAIAALAVLLAPGLRGLRSARVLVAVLGFGVLSVAGRAVYEIFTRFPMRSYFDTTPFEVLVHAFINFAPLQMTLCFLLILRDRSQQQLERVAALDPLLGIANRRNFAQRGLALLAQNQRQQTAVALVLIDIDHFKLVNDRCGHQIGDEALKAVVAALQRHLRPADVLGRHGGEEFIVLLDRTDQEAATLVAERLRQAVAAIRFEHQGELLPLRISLGVAVAEAAHDRLLGEADLQQLIRRADAALYAAKQGGRDRWCLG